MNTKPSIRLVRIFSAASGWREMPSEDLAMAIPMAMAPDAPAAPMAMAAAACGADGLIIEVHNDPAHALCDGAQSLRPEQFAELAQAVRTVRAAALEAEGGKQA